MCKNVWNDVTGKTAAKKQTDALRRSQEEQNKIFEDSKRVAEDARTELRGSEDLRQENIRGGTGRIEDAFRSFDDPYYDRIANTYTEAYLPEIDDQFARTRDKLIAQLAGKGQLGGSGGNDKLAELERAAASERGNVAGKGRDFAQGVRTKVSETKSKLYNDNLTAADPNAIAARATGEATTLAQSGNLPPVQPLGDIFGSLLAPLANGLTSYSNRRGNPRTGGGLAPTTGSGSSHIVN